MSSTVKNYEFKGGLKSASMVLILLGAVGYGMSASMNHTVGWVDFLVGSLFVTTIAVSGIFFLALSGVIQASWLTPYKRIPEAMTQFLPISFVLMSLTLIGSHTIYEWTHKDVVANDPILSEKVSWLNEPRFIFTMVVIFILWITFSTILRRFSDKLEGENNLEVAGKLVGFSAVSLIVFGLTICLAAFDWIMSIEPHWFSTIFGIYVFAGTFVSGIAFITLCILHLKDNGYLEGVVNENHLHDLGKWMFGMSVFWAYIWVSQYLLIWYANIPEETEYFVMRHHHWGSFFWVNFVINFVVPFFVLMPRGNKRNPKIVKCVARILIVGHFMDLYLMVAPKVFEHHNIHGVSGYGIVQVLQLLGMFGLLTFIVFRALARRNLVPVNDPTFEEGSHLHQ